MESRLDHFGEFIMAHLRDPGIQFWEILATGQWKAPALAALQERVAAMATDQREVVRDCVIHAIDHATHDFLFALQEESDTQQSICMEVDGADVAAESDGLQGEPYGENGWIARFSQFPGAFD